MASTPDPAQLQACHLLVTWVHAQSANSAWLNAPSSAAAGRPTLFVGMLDDLLALPPRLQAAAAGFLMDGWQPDEALVRLSLALTLQGRQAPPSPADGRVPVLVAGKEDTAATLLAALESAGMQVHRAADGSQALEIVRRVQPLATVLDIDLPGADGFDVLAALRSEHAAMGIVILTGQQREGDLVRGFALGADDYVVKPFSPMELAARLKRLIHK